MPHPTFLINVIFFQQQTWTDVDYVPEEGAVAVMRSGLLQTMSQGIIMEDPLGHLGEMTGQMQDVYGRAKLLKIQLTETELSFTKCYIDRDDPIRYVFERRRGSIWLGEYSGPKVGRGVTKCILTKVSDGFFLPERLRGGESAHTWE